MEVAPGVHWVRMPLPFSLQWINLWRRFTEWVVQSWSTRGFALKSVHLKSVPCTGDVSNPSPCGMPKRQDLSGLDPSDFGALYTDPGHQASLVEDKGIGIVLEGRGGQVFGNACIHDDHGRADADLPTI